MRPTSSRDETSKFRWVIIGIIVLAIVAGVIVTINYTGFGGENDVKLQTEPHFSLSELVDEKISPEENTLMRLEILNSSKRFYENLEIRISTLSPKIKINPINPRVKYEHLTQYISEEDTEYILIVSDPLGLGELESTRTYTFEIKSELYSGTISTTIEIKTVILANGEKTDEKVFKLTVSSEG